MSSCLTETGKAEGERKINSSRSVSRRSHLSGIHLVASGVESNISLLCMPAGPKGKNGGQNSVCSVLQFQRLLPLEMSELERMMETLHLVQRVELLISEYK